MISAPRSEWTFLGVRRVGDDVRDAIVEDRAEPGEAIVLDERLTRAAGNRYRLDAHRTPPPSREPVQGIAAPA